MSEANTENTEVRDGSPITAPPEMMRRDLFSSEGLHRIERALEQNETFDCVMRASIDPASIDVEARTAKISFSSETPVRRWYGTEILGHKTGEVRMDWFKSGRAPLLLDHWGRQIGVVVSASVKGKRGEAVVKFSRNERAEEEFQDVRDGIRTNISVGYRVFASELVSKSDKEGSTYRITDWEPLEASMVDVPADMTVGVGRSASDVRPVQEDADVKRADEERSKAATQQATAMETRAMSQTDQGRGAAPSAPNDAEIAAIRARSQEDESKRRKEISEICTRAGMKTEFQLRAINEDWTVEQTKGHIIEELTPKRGEKGKGDVVNPFGRNAAELDLTDKEVKSYSLFRAIVASVNKDWRGAEFERECHIELEKRFNSQANGFFVPQDIVARGMRLCAGGANVQQRIDELERMVRDLTTSTAGTPFAGYLVGTDHRADMFIEVLRNRAQVLGLGARLMTGLVGNIDIPKQTAGGAVTWVGEGFDTSETNQVFGQVTMSPKTASARTDISRRLLLQSDPSVEFLVREDLMRIIGLAFDLAGINGSGATGTNAQPTGVLNTSGIGSVSMGTPNGGSPTWGKIIDLETEVAIDNADLGALAYLTNAKVRGKLKQTEKATNTGQFIWSDGNELNGYRAAVSNQVPSNFSEGSSGAVLSGAIFGNWNDLLLGMWGVLDLKADETTLGDSGGLVLRAFMDVDVAVRHAESFAASTDIVTT